MVAGVQGFCSVQLLVGDPDRVIQEARANRRYLVVGATDQEWPGTLSSQISERGAEVRSALLSSGAP